MKTPQEAASKLVARAGVAGEDYDRGVRNPRRPWAAATTGAEANYKTGVTASLSKGSWARGVSRVGDQGWQTGALTKGTQRFSAGVAAGQQSYVQGVTPYFQAVQSLSLPPRGPRGSESNYQRAVLVGKTQNALRQKV